MTIIWSLALIVGFWFGYYAMGFIQRTAVLLRKVEQAAEALQGMPETLDRIEAHLKDGLASLDRMTEEREVEK